MKSSIKNITVDITNSAHSPETVVEVQGDNLAREVHISVMDDGYPYNLSEVFPILRGTKPDGKTVFIYCPVINNKVIVTLTSQLLVAEGFSTYEIALYKIDNLDHITMDHIDLEDFDYDFYLEKGKVVTSFPFKLKVTKSFFNVNNLISSDEFKICNDIVGDTVRFEALVNSLPKDYIETVAEVKRLQREKADWISVYKKEQADDIFVRIDDYSNDKYEFTQRLEVVEKDVDEIDIDVDKLQKELETLKEYVKAVLSDSIVYGFIEHYEYDITSPNRIEYIEANKNFAPLLQRSTVKQKSGKMEGYGDWENLSFLTQNKPYMVKGDGTIHYRLTTDQNTVRNEVTHNKDWTNHSDDDPGQYATNNDCNVMAWIPRIYKYEEYLKDKDGKVTGRIVKFCNQQRDGFEPTGFVDHNNRVLEGVWIPVFYGCAYEKVKFDKENKPTVESYEKMRSLLQAEEEVYPSTYLTVEQMKDSISKSGERCDFFGGPIMETLFDLMVLFAKSANLIDMYGHGNLGGSAPMRNSVEGWWQFYGTDKNDHTVNRVFYSEVLGTHDIFQVDPYVISDKGHIKFGTWHNVELNAEHYVDSGLVLENMNTYSEHDTIGVVTLDNPKLIKNFGAIPDDDNVTLQNNQDIKATVIAYINRILEVCTEFSSTVNGNIDYRKAPIIQGVELKKKYPNDDIQDNDYYTMYNTTYEIDGYQILVNPIEENKNILTESELSDYVDTLDTTHGIRGLLNSDTKKLIVHVTNDIEASIDTTSIGMTTASVKISIPEYGIDETLMFNDKPEMEYHNYEFLALGYFGQDTGWKLKALKPCVVDNVNYAAEEIIATWTFTNQYHCKAYYSTSLDDINKKLDKIELKYIEYSLLLSQLTKQSLDMISQYVQGIAVYGDMYKAPIFLTKFKNINTFDAVPMTRLGWRGYSTELISKTYEFSSTMEYHQNRGCSMMIFPPPGYKPF